ncbi:GlxA family transcriptional regulator [bacterium]|nr:GlxA family transcriptional regulator [bacterium]
MTEIGIFNYPGAQQAALHGLTDLFTVASTISQEHGGPRVGVSHWTLQDLSSPANLAALIVPGTMAGLPPFPGMEHSTDWLHKLHGRGVTLCSVCGGAFVLASSGLLNGRTVTTHWMFAQRLQELYPALRVDSDKLIIEDGELITAGGVMAWVDLGLKLVYRFLGPTVTLHTARFFLVDPAGREQRFYNSFTPNLNHGDELVLQIQHWLQQNYAEAHSVSALAERTQMSERTFLRRFQKATGLKPTEYLQSLRVGKAREALEFSKDSVNQIAWKVGYEDPGAFRKIFQRLIGLSPGYYRRRFAVGLN